MAEMTSREFLDLVAVDAGHCASIYLPLEQGGQASQQNPIRARNLVREAERQLADKGAAAREVDDLLAKPRSLAADPAYWQQGGRGLAWFVSPAGFRECRFSVALPEAVRVGHRFYVKPLVPVVLNQGAYYVLAVSQNRVRLFRGDRCDMAEVEVTGLPTNLADALRLDQPEGMYFAHTGERHAKTKQGLVFFGHGGSVDVVKDNILSYFRTIDRALHAFLREHAAPLVFAGVDYLFPIYQESNTYPELIAQHVAGNPDGWSPAQIREQAWPLASEVFCRPCHAALARFGKSYGHGLTVDNLRAVVLAARRGAVDSLFVNCDLGVWGRVIGDDEIVIDSEPRHDSEDLVDLAIVETLRRGGHAYPVPANQTPGQGTIAALLRYPLPELTLGAAAVTR